MLLFSATLPNWIQGITDRYMRSDKVVIDLVEEKEKASGDVEHYTIRCPWQVCPRLFAHGLESTSSHERFD